MPDEANQNGRFEPIHDAHAIEQVLFVLQVDHPLDDVNFAEARKVAEQFAPELPGRAEIQGFAFAIGTPGPVGPMPSGPPVGSVFHRTAPDGTIESELRIERASVTFRTSLYTRWDAVWARARKYFDAMAPKYVAQARISAISLNYVDKFAWIGALTECRPSLLLRPRSSYLCPHVYDAKDLWHSHTGAFLQVGNDTKRLLNINVDYLDENRPDGLRRLLTIRTVLTDLINQPGYASLEMAAKDAAKFLDAHMQELHDFGKVLFSDIINDEMSKRIALIE